MIRSTNTIIIDMCDNPYNVAGIKSVISRLYHNSHLECLSNNMSLYIVYNRHNASEQKRLTQLTTNKAKNARKQCNIFTNIYKF
jgi:hypothetical protein